MDQAEKDIRDTLEKRWPCDSCSEGYLKRFGKHRLTCAANMVEPVVSLMLEQRRQVIAKFADLSVEMEKHSNDHLHDKDASMVMGASVEGVCSASYSVGSVGWCCSVCGGKMEEIPKLTEYDHKPNSPGWFQPTQGEWIGDEHVIHQLKPVIRCNCGNFCGIGLHHVHADGTVTASFYHKKGTNYEVGESDEGCDWHVFLKLKDYSGGEFLPIKDLPKYEA